MIYVRIQLVDGTKADCLMEADAFDLMRQIAGQRGTHFAVGGYKQDGKKLAHIALKDKCALITFEELPNAAAAGTDQRDQNPRGPAETGAGRGRREEGSTELRGTEGEHNGTGDDKPSEGG